MKSIVLYSNILTARLSIDISNRSFSGVSKFVESTSVHFCCRDFLMRAKLCQVRKELAAALLPFKHKHDIPGYQVRRV